jgi:L-ascorbate metabolism protein UlaG (beta-lactamase superfamily)
MSRCSTLVGISDWNQRWRESRARRAIPHHFGTSPGIVPNADSFAAELRKLKIDFYEMKPGETISFRGKQLIRAK